MRTIYPATVVGPPAPLGPDVDQTEALNAWVKALPNGPGEMRDIDWALIADEYGPVRAATVVDFAGAVYRVDGTLLVQKLDVVFKNLNLIRVPQVTDPTYKGKPHVVFDHSAFVRFVGCTVTGPKPAGMTYQAQRESETAFRFLGSVGCELVRPRTTAIWGDHLYFGKTNRNPRRSRGILVTGGVFGDCGRDPIAATACEDVTVEDCSFGTGRTCIDAEPNGTQGGVYGLNVWGCTFNGPYTGLFLAALGGSDVGVVNGVTVEKNTGNRVSLQALVGGGERRANFTVIGNTGDVSVGNSRGSVMSFSGVEGEIVVTGNRNPVNAGRNMEFARFTNCDTATIIYEDNA